MYSILKLKPVSFLAKETPALVLSTLIAEFLYKFGSFTVELIAFFMTWYALSMVASAIMPDEK